MPFLGGHPVDDFTGIGEELDFLNHADLPATGEERGHEKDRSEDGNRTDAERHSILERESHVWIPMSSQVDSPIANLSTILSAADDLDGIEENVACCTETDGSEDLSDFRQGG